MPGAEPHARDDCPICRAFGLDPGAEGSSITPIASEGDLAVLIALMERAGFGAASG